MQPLVRFLALSTLLAPAVRPVVLPVMPTAAPQASVVDAGRFVITQGGQRIGTESFSITRMTGVGGTQLLVTDTLRIGDRETVATMRTDASGSPSAYDSKTMEGGAGTVRVFGARSGNRFTLTLRNRSGDASTKELQVANDLMLLDQELYGQLYILFLEAAPKSPTLVTPLTAARTSGALVGQGPDNVRIGERDVSATRFTFGDMKIWVGSANNENRIVRIEIPSRNLVVAREQPPR